MTIRRSLLAALVVFAMLVPSPAAAQRLTLNEPPPGPPRLDLSGSGGLLLSSDWSDLVLLGSVSPVGGALEQVLVRDLVVDPGPVYDGTITYWEGRYGFRAHAGFAKSCLAVGRHCGDIASVTAESGTVKVKNYSYDIGGAVGLLNHRPGRWVWPYAFVGVGGVTYDLDRTVGPPLTFIERRPAGNGPAAVITRDPDPLIISIDELGVETRLAFNVGFGTDFRIPMGPAGLGVRFELSDHVHESPINLQVSALDAFRRDDVDLDFGLVHNLRAAVGVVLHFGR
jgi:hypothetical protein